MNENWIIINIYARNVLIVDISVHIIFIYVHD
jgi:hypothetical protein